jgi:hypothetical protein
MSEQELKPCPNQHTHLSFESSMYPKLTKSAGMVFCQKCSFMASIEDWNTRPESPATGDVLERAQAHVLTLGFLTEEWLPDLLVDFARKEVATLRARLSDRNAQLSEMEECADDIIWKRDERTWNIRKRLDGWHVWENIAGSPHPKLGIFPSLALAREALRAIPEASPDQPDEREEDEDDG